MKKLISGPGFNHLVEARHGYVLYNVNDRYIGRIVEHYGEWSPGETALFGRFCRPGHYVVDVGANIGTHTLAFARLVGRAGRVFAFEPQRMMVQVLAANVALNSLTNVHTYHLGVGAEDGALWLADIDYLREGNFGGVSLGAVARPRGDPRPKCPGRRGAAGRFLRPSPTGPHQDRRGRHGGRRVAGSRRVDPAAQARHLCGERQAREVARAHPAYPEPRLQALLASPAAVRPGQLRGEYEEHLRSPDRVVQHALRPHRRTFRFEG